MNTERTGGAIIARVNTERTAGQVRTTIARAKAKRARKALRNIRNAQRAGLLAVASITRPRARKAPAVK